jgi:hypothetical protein
MTLVPFLQKVKSSLRNPLILLIEYKVNFEYLEFLQINANLSFTKESMMLFIFSEIKKEENVKYINQEYFANLFYSQITEKENYFYQEINDFCKECSKISLELFCIFKDYNLYTHGFLEYQFADLLEEDILILHKPNKEATYVSKTDNYPF